MKRWVVSTKIVDLALLGTIGSEGLVETTDLLESHLDFAIKGTSFAGHKYSLLERHCVKFKMHYHPPLL